IGLSAARQRGRLRANARMAAMGRFIVAEGERGRAFVRLAAARPAEDAAVSGRRSGGSELERAANLPAHAFANKEAGGFHRDGLAREGGGTDAGPIDAGGERHEAVVFADVEEVELNAPV